MTTMEEDVLAHFGKKGMKWGVRKKYISTGDIKEARARRDNREAVAKAKVKSATTDAARAKAKANLVKVRQDLKTGVNQDNAVATRMTNGEKTVAILLAGPFGLIPIVSRNRKSDRIGEKLN